MAELLSPNAATLSGKSAPHIPGPSIGSMRTTLAPILTEPDFMQATSASCLQSARSPNMKPRPQPASASSTPAPTRQNPAPFFMLAKMRAVPLTRLQRLPPAIPLRIRNPCQQAPTALNGPTLSAHIKQAAGGRITPQEIMPKRSCPREWAPWLRYRNGRQGQVHFPGHYQCAHCICRERGRDLYQYRLSRRFHSALAESLPDRLACCRRARIFCGSVCPS